MAMEDRRWRRVMDGVQGLRRALLRVGAYLEKRPWLRRGLIAAGVFLGIFGIPFGLAWHQATALADRHTSHAVAHPGWSFPARIFSPPVPLAGSTPTRLKAEARARAYRERCPRPGPGEYCPHNGRVTPRLGQELEPLFLGYILGPDSEIREHLPLGEAPRHLLQAIVAAEDRAFYSHSGVNFKAVLRALLANAREGFGSQGASTLTMQLVRNWREQREKTLLRKVQEAVYAALIDSYLGKDGVMQMYLDAPYLGQRGGLSICGFEAAAQHYFGKHARSLDLAEAATLAAILPSPGKLSPAHNQKGVRERRDLVLRAMAKLFGLDVQEALARPVQVVAPRDLVELYPAYLSAVRTYLSAKLAPEVLYGAGLVVTAAIDVPLQQETERLFEEKTLYLESLIGRRKEPLQSAAVLLDVADGRLRAIWGGRGLASTDFNRAVAARRQPGSAFKPLVYALAFSQPPGKSGKPRFTAASTEPNAPRVFKTQKGDWSPRNVLDEYTPTASLAYALAWSQNIATASLLEELGGPEPLLAFAARLGFDTRLFPREMGLALGQAETSLLEMAQFTAVVANGGRRIAGTPVLRAIDAAGKERLGGPLAGPVVLDEKAALLTRELMRLVIDYGTGGAARGVGGESGYQGPAAGKTGTSDRERDAWFIGANPRWAGVVWLGMDQPTPLGAAASDLASPLWGWWFHRLSLLEGTRPSFVDPIKLTQRPLCTVTGKLAGLSCRVIVAPFLPGTEPTARCQEEHAPREPADTASAHRHESLWKRAEREAEVEELDPLGED